MKNTKDGPMFQKSFIGTILTVTGAIGTFASLMLSIEEFKYLKNPGAALNCDLNPLIGCGSILNTWQGHVFLGVPNQFWGLAAFSVLTALGVLLLSKVQLPRWIWQGLQVGIIGGLLFVLWFMYQSVFVLNHLCPYCMVTWVVMLVAGWYVTIHNLREKNIPIAKTLAPAVRFVTKHHLDILITIFVLIIGGILLRFSDFFFG